MRLGCMVIAGGWLAIALCVYLIVRAVTPESTPRPLPAQAQGTMQGDSERSARLSAQIEELQRTLTAMKAQLGAARHENTAQQAAAACDSKQPEIRLRQDTADVEQRRVSTAEVAEAFSQEQFDGAWANQAAARIGSTFGKDEALREIPRTVECREQTCRLQVNEDGARTLSDRLPYVATELADVLPSISAEHIEQGSGDGALVIYLSSQPSPTGAPQRR
jgi:hypothetical protein